MSIIKPVHPGEILWGDFLEPMGISCYRLAKDINVPVNRVTAIVYGERAITPETGLMLSRYFGLPDGLWCGLQSNYDVECAKEAIKEKLEQIPAIKYVARI